MAKILIVEDDQNLRETIIQWLEFDRHMVEGAGDGAAGWEFFQTYEYDILILDWELPELNGLEFCKRVRARGNKVPVLFLTGRGTIPDKTAGFDAGADDYLTKPFHMQELSLRIKALLRRPPLATESRLKARHIELSPESHQVWKSGEEIRLTRTEFALLEGLLRSPNKLFSADAMLQKFWPAQAEPSSDALRTALKKLRDKIDVDGEPSLIKNVHGQGYKLDLPEA